MNNSNSGLTNEQVALLVTVTALISSFITFTAMMLSGAI